jgi:2-oxo-3-hexenedioate decarboxylase
MAEIRAIADEAFACLGAGRQIEPFSVTHALSRLDDAYRVAADVRARREARGERVIGRKIGFTNRTIWDEYGVHAPIWGYMYDTTVADLPAPAARASLAGLAEPRIEPEIIFGLDRAPTSNMDVAALAACIGWVAHGFEIVQSIFPAWRFTAADTVAGYGLHGRLFVGPRHAFAPRAEAFARELETFTIELSCDGRLRDRGRAVNVLDGPLHALKHLVAALAASPHLPPLAAGEMVTTGTLTRAFPVASGETWSTRLSGLPIENADIAFA